MVSVIITAAGVGTRFGAAQPKQFARMKNGMTVLGNTLAAFIFARCVEEIILTVPGGCAQVKLKNELVQFVNEQIQSMNTQIQSVNHMYNPDCITHIINGGANRSESVYAALKKTNPHSKIILIHDGVRPLVSPALIENIAEAAQKYGAVVPGIPSSDTLKEINVDYRVVSTPHRSRFIAVQTPQGFRRDIILSAYTAMFDKSPDLSAFTDDAALVEANGGTVYIVPGERRNIKITTPDDLRIADALWEAGP